MKSKQNTEKGQALILITMALVALLGFTAVAVDGSMVYSDRRYSQAAADSSAMAGSAAAAELIARNNITEADWTCSKTNVVNARNAAVSAALARATSNAVTLETDLNNQHGVSAVCYDSATQKYIEITVQVTTDTQTSFAHYVTGAPLRGTVTAVSRVYPRRALAHGFTIVALNPADCSGQKNGALFHGGAVVVVCGGGIFSNGCMRGDGSIDVKVKDLSCQAVSSTGVYYASDLFKGGGISPAPQLMDHIDADSYKLEFTPEELCARPGATHIDASDLPSTLSPGLWCISGSIGLHGNKGGTLIAQGSTLVLLDGGISCNGQCNFQISAPSSSPDPYPAVPGLAIYSLANSDWKLNGNSVSFFRGTILVPNANLEMNGNGNENSFKTQVIAKNFDASGSNVGTYKWSDELMFTKPAVVELIR